jgi:2',3'-cyclic-nucleotide 2'-phosphodiesterase (5'-nucleotidase family)
MPSSMLDRDSGRRAMKISRRCALLLGALLCVSTVGALAQTSSRKDDGRIHIVLLHTNDIHGQMLTRKATWLSKSDPPMVGGLPRVAAYVNAVREEVKKTGDGLIVVDAGDWYQGTPEGLVNDGLDFVTAMALVGYDAVCIGNHEFDHGVANVARLIQEAKLPAVCANLEVKATHKPVDWVPPYRIVEVKGVKVGIVGLLTPVTPQITSHDARSLDFLDPSQTLARVKQELAGRVDWILPITHLGVDDDRKLARSDPELPVIVGGHSHTYLKEGAIEGTTHILQTGSKAGSVGRVELALDAKTHKIVDVRVHMIDLVEEPAPEFKNRELEAMAKKLEDATAERMKAVIGELEAPLQRAKDPLASSTAGNFIADALREHTQADVALMNRGGIRCDLEAGKVTRRDVFEIVPFDNNVTVLTLSGAELHEMIRRAVEGKTHSGIEVSGLEIHITGEGNAHKLVGLKVGKKELDPKATYRVAMNSFMADGGDAYLDKKDGTNRVDEPIFVRDMLEEWIAHQGKVKPDATNRYVVKKS